jgi:hypothetical protein
MKKTLLSCALLMGLSAAAQTPTFDFETWNAYGIGDADHPTGWITANILTSPIIAPPPNNNPQSVFKGTASGDFHGGAMSAKVNTVKLNTNPAQGILPDTVGLIAVGVINTTPLSYKLGTPYTLRPSTMSFWYKSEPMTGDTCGASISLWAWQSGVKVYLGFGEFTTTSQVTTMTQQNVTINYDPAYAGLIPDSMSIIAGSSYHRSFLTPGSKIGSQFWIDDIQLTGGNVGIFDYAKTSAQINVYPNPANTFVNFSTNSKEAKSVSVFDLTGKLVGVYTLEEGKLKLQTSEFHTGIYMYAVTGESKQVISTGKFNIAK